MRDKDIEEIRALELFSGIEESHFEHLMHAAYFQTFPPMVDLITQGDNADFLYIVVEGTVELFANWNNLETTLGFINPVTTFILAATITDGPFLKSARTLTKCRIMLIPSEDIRHIFYQDANFARGVVKELANRYRTVVKDAKNIKLRTGAERLANYLLREYNLNSSQDHFELRIEKRKLAAFLGMTPENLSRSIKSLKEHGLECEGSIAKITDLNKLKALAKPTPLIDDYTV